MKTFDKKEYLELCTKYLTEQYDDDAAEVYEDNKHDELLSYKTKAVDLTNTKFDQIKDEMLKCTNLRIGQFKIRIKNYSAMPSKDGQSTITINLELWEEKNKTMSGHPCKMDFPINLEKDSRFLQMEWITYFSGNQARNLPIDTVIEIIRWLQAITKMPCFL